MTATYTSDVLSSLGGYGSYGPGGDWGGYWGKHGPELLDHRLALYAGEQRMVFGATTFRQFASMLASGTGKPETGDPWVTRMRNLPATVVSATLSLRAVESLRHERPVFAGPAGAPTSAQAPRNAASPAHLGPHSIHATNNPQVEIAPVSPEPPETPGRFSWPPVIMSRLNVSELRRRLLPPFWVKWCMSGDATLTPGCETAVHWPARADGASA